MQIYHPGPRKNCRYNLDQECTISPSLLILESRISNNWNLKFNTVVPLQSKLAYDLQIDTNLRTWVAHTHSVSASQIRSGQTNRPKMNTRLTVKLLDPTCSHVLSVRLQMYAVATHNCEAKVFFSPYFAKIPLVLSHWEWKTTRTCWDLLTPPEATECRLCIGGWILCQRWFNYVN